MQTREYACPTCGNPLYIRRGRRGEFWACSTYPQCRVALKMDADGAPVMPAETGVSCELCGAPMVVKRGPRGPFLACSTYPRCRSIKPWTTRPDEE